MPAASTTGVGSIRDARRDLYRQQIMTAAELEFSRSGFAEARMSAIAQTAGLSLATVYKHFAGKTEIWDDLHTERMNALLGEVAATTREAGTAVERLVDGIATTARFLAEHDAYLEMSIHAGAGWASDAEAAVGVQRTVWSAGQQMIAGAPEAAAAAGELRDLRPSVAAGLVVSALQVWMTDWVTSGRDRSPEAVVAELVAHLRWVLIGD